MAFKAKFSLVVVLALFLVLTTQASDYGLGYRRILGEPASSKIQSRKVVIGMERKEEGLTKQVLVDAPTGKLVDWELRKVPSGPDPLHHNGGSPKKPRTP